METILDPEKMLLDSPLYKKYDREGNKISALENFKEPIDTFCVQCGSDSIFTRDGLTPNQRKIQQPTGWNGGSTATLPRFSFQPFDFSIRFSCSRNSEHKLFFFFHVDENTVCKIGEFPSQADRLFPALGKYKSYFGDFFQEYHSALTLRSHGFGIGSFTYLRRVFEKILHAVASRKYLNQEEWNYKAWKKDKHVKDVISILSSELPDFLVENTSLYSILSKGIHELEEDECLASFDIVKTAIQEIVEDFHQKDEKKKGRKLISKQLNDLNSRHSA